jgi:hypothetical protein
MLRRDGSLPCVKNGAVPSDAMDKVRDKLGGGAEHIGSRLDQRTARQALSSVGCAIQKASTGARNTATPRRPTPTASTNPASTRDRRPASRVARQVHSRVTHTFSED